MYKHVWSVICRQSKIDAETQNISLHDVIERITIDTTKPDTPEGLKEALDKGDKINLQIAMELVSYISTDDPKKDHEVELSIDIFDPDGQTLGTINPKLKFENNVSRIKSRAKFNTVPVTTAGTYNFIVSMPPKAGKDPEQVAEIPLIVEIKS